MFIEDGTGGGFQAGVTDSNRLYTMTLAESIIEVATFNERTYAFATPVINLTNAAESGILYIKNNHSSDSLLVTTVLTSLGKSTGGTPGDVVLKYYQNPTTGTLITAGTVFAPVNRNLGSSVPPQSASTYGAQGSTITNGTVFETLILKDQLYQEVSSSIVIPNGSSLAISIQPPTGNTSENVTLTAITAFVDPADVGSIS